jgi:CBS domain-containing protein
MALRIVDVMDREWVSVESGSTAIDCTREMLRRRHGFALVTRDQRPWGIVTEWDLLSKVVAPGRDPSTVRVEEIATTPIISCRVDTPFAEVVQTMAERGIRRMLVVGGDGQVQGAITSRAVLQLFRPYIDEITREIAGFTSSL